MRNKRGQFFLIAAVIIITVVVSIVTISNYTKTEETVKLYDLGEELGIESQQVLDYGTYNGLSEDEMKDLMETFIHNYISYIEEEKNIYFIFGNKNKVNIIGYQDLNNEVVCVKLNPPTHICGDGIVNQKSEECDDGCLSDTPSVCTAIDNEDGCSSFCKIESALVCNSDAQIEYGEFCDSENLKEKTCASFGLSEPAEIEAGQTALKCNDCGFDISGCKTPEETEECIPLEMEVTQEFGGDSEEISKVAIVIEGFTYEFKLNPGENFYFVIWQTIGEEQQVVTSND